LQFAYALLVDLVLLELLASGRGRVVVLLKRPHLGNVVLHLFEALVGLEERIDLIGVVDVGVALPFDVVAKVDLWEVGGVGQVVLVTGVRHDLVDLVGVWD
jgi:hypothetical protein